MWARRGWPTECLRLGEANGDPTARVSATRSAADVPLGAFAPLLPELGAPSVDLLGAARRVLRERAGDRRLLLLVDDAHLLDDVSATLLLHLAEDPTVFVVATVRRGEETPDAVTTLWRNGLARRVEVTELPEEEMDLLAAEILGGLGEGSGPADVDDSTAARLRSLADGNPLALRELVLGAVESGEVSVEEGTWRAPGDLSVPRRLSELVSERIGGLDEAARLALELVALGEPLGVSMLDRIVPAADMELLEQRQLVDVRADRRRLEVWLAHPLHGEVLRAEMPVLRRRKVLRMLADALAATSSRRGGDVLRLALWRLELGDTDEADLLLDAARQAYVALDERRAAALAGAAWAADRTAAAGHLLGHLHCQLAQHDEAESVLAEVSALELDDRHRVLVGMARSENLFRMDRYDDAIAVVEAAESHVVDPDWRAELVGHRATLVMLNGRAGEAHEIVAPLLDSPSVRTFVEAAIAGAITAAYGGRPVTGLELARKAFAAHLGVWEQELFQSDPSVHVFSELLALTQAGLLEEAEQLAAAMHAAALQSQRGAAIAAMALQRGLVASERGQPRTAAKWFGRALPLYDRDGPAQRRRFPLAGLVLAWATLGDATAGRMAERTLLASDGSALRFTRAAELCARALLAAADHQPADAVALVDEALAVADDSGERSGAALALHTYARLGHPELAAERAAALRPDVEGELLAARCDHVVAAAAADAAALAGVAGRFAALRRPPVRGRGLRRRVTGGATGRCGSRRADACRTGARPRRRVRGSGDAGARPDRGRRPAVEAGARGGDARRRGADVQGHRRAVVPVAPDRREPPAPRLRQARHHRPRRPPHRPRPRPLTPSSKLGAADGG